MQYLMSAVPQPLAPANSAEAIPSQTDAAQTCAEECIPLDPIGFASTTAILTPAGPRPASQLRVDDPVSTRSGQLARISTLQTVTLTAEDLHANPDAAPVRFDPAALPGMSCDAALLVSGDLAVHLPAVADGSTAALNSEFPAKAFCDGGRIRRVIPSSGITYVHFTLDGPQQICASGVWVEVDAPCPEPLSGVPSLWHGADSYTFRPLT